MIEHVCNQKSEGVDINHIDGVGWCIVFDAYRVIHISYCPFCGVNLKNKDEVRLADVATTEADKENGIKLIAMIVRERLGHADNFDFHIENTIEASEIHISAKYSVLSDVEISSND